MLVKSPHCVIKSLPYLCIIDANLSGNTIGTTQFDSHLPHSTAHAKLQIQRTNRLYRFAIITPDDRRLICLKIAVIVHLRFIFHRSSEKSILFIPVSSKALRHTYILIRNVMDGINRLEKINSKKYAYIFIKYLENLLCIFYKLVFLAFRSFSARNENPGWIE